MVHALDQFFKSKWVHPHAAERSEGIEVPMHIVRVAAGLCFGPIAHVQPGLLPNGLRAQNCHCGGREVAEHIGHFTPPKRLLHELKCA